MPNRGELPTPTMRAKTAVRGGKSGPDGEAWTIIAFCAIGWLMTMYFALTTTGTDTLPKLMSQIPWG
ncbi:MAG TPA: hypothetical protein VHY10_16700 [Xanthobacteraceae bacterium]|nr:hypothetical protein [Xanthobacteraceae bacterium]